MTYSPKFRGNVSTAPSSAVSSGYQNGTAGDLVQCTPVSVNGSGQIINIDVTDVNSINRFVGLLGSDTPSSANGLVFDAGRIEKVNLGFAVGDAIYVSKSGFLTNLKPDYGVGGFTVGDWVVFVGVIVQNQYDNTKKDLKLFLSVIGQI